MSLPGSDIPPLGAFPGPAAAPRSDHWVWQVTALSVVLGVMVSLAVTTTARIRQTGVSGSRLGVSAAFMARYREQNAQQQAEIVALRRERDRYMANVEGDSEATEGVKRRFAELKRVSGLSAAEGPGLVITIHDNVPASGAAPLGNYVEYMVHDQDLNNLLAELKAAGAQQLGISGVDTANPQRVVVTTTARCVGPSAVVNGTYLSAPYHLYAIGDPKALRGALERPDGYIHTRGLDARKMITIEESPQVRVPEYAGALTAHYAKPVEE